MKLLKAGGLQALEEAVAEQVNFPDLTTESRRKVNFLIGVRATRLRAWRAYEKGGLSAAEAALRQPYDMSAASLSR